MSHILILVMLCYYYCDKLNNISISNMCYSLCRSGSIISVTINKFIDFQHEFHCFKFSHFLRLFVGIFLYLYLPLSSFCSSYVLLKARVTQSLVLIFIIQSSQKFCFKVSNILGIWPQIQFCVGSTTTFTTPFRVVQIQLRSK